MRTEGFVDECMEVGLALAAQLCNELGPLGSEDVGASEGPVASNDGERVNALLDHVMGGGEATFRCAE